MRFKSCQGLRGRFLFVTGSLIMLSSFTLATFHFYQARKSLLEELRKRGFALTQNLSSQTVRPLEAGDSSSLEELLATTCTEEDVKYAMVQDERGQILAEAATGGFDVDRVRPVLVASSWAPPTVDLLKFKTGDGKILYNFSAPVWALPGGDQDSTGDPWSAGAVCRRAGTVRVGICTAPTVSRIAGHFWISMALGLGTTLLGLAGVVGVTRWTLKPLGQMASAAHAIARGDLTRRVEVWTGDEIGTLGQAFNEMTESLARSTESLERRNEELEGAAREHERLFQEAKVRTMRLRVMNELSMAMAASLEPDEIYAQVHRQLGRLMNYEYLTVLRHLAEEDAFRRDFVWVDRPDLGVHAQVELPAGTPLLDQIHRTRMPRSAPDLVADPLTADGWLVRNGFKSGFLVPILVRGEFLGIVGVASRRRNAFARTEVSLLGTVANNLGLVLKNADLYQRLQRSFEEVQVAQEQLAHSENTRNAEKLRSVGQMASGVAHDFNNVLAAIVGRVQLVRMKADRGKLGPEDLDANLEVIERAALDGAETVRRIQEFSRDRNLKPDLQRADLNNLVREAVEITRTRWKTQAEQGGLRVEVVTELGRVPQIACVPSEVREVLTNLIFNAVDAMPEGGTITLSTHSDGGRPCVHVADTGTGMPPEVRERIFEPFFTTKGVKGSGLGLSIVFGIVQRHGGAISVNEEYTRGTEFRIRFPAAGADASEPLPEPTLTGSSCRILVGDDEANVRETLVELLVTLGHEVVQAGSGEEILARFEPGRFDLVFTDLGMPDMSGWEVTRRIRERDPAVPVVLVTGWGNQIGVEEAREQGVSRVLAKPFTVQKVTSAIAEIQGARKAA